MICVLLNLKKRYPTCSYHCDHGAYYFDYRREYFQNHDCYLIELLDESI